MRPITGYRRAVFIRMGWKSSWNSLRQSFGGHRHNRWHRPDEPARPLKVTDGKFVTVDAMVCRGRGVRRDVHPVPAIGKDGVPDIRAITRFPRHGLIGDVTRPRHRIHSSILKYSRAKHLTCSGCSQRMCMSEERPAPGRFASRTNPPMLRHRRDRRPQTKSQTSAKFLREIFITVAAEYSIGWIGETPPLMINVDYVCGEMGQPKLKEFPQKIWSFQKDQSSGFDSRSGGFARPYHFPWREEPRGRRRRRSGGTRPRRRCAWRRG